MKRTSELASSSSIKSTGDKNVTPESQFGVTKMSPRDRAEKVAGGRMKVENLWAKIRLLDIVDDGLSHFAFRVKALFKIPMLDGKPISLSHEEIGEVMSCSGRQAMRAGRELEEHGDIVVERRHNFRNVYTLRVKEIIQRKASVPPVVTVVAAHEDWPTCSLCQRRRPKLLKVGWCRSCNSVKNTEKISERVARRVVRETIEKIA